MFLVDINSVLHPKQEYVRQCDSMPHNHPPQFPYDLFVFAYKVVFSGPSLFILQNRLISAVRIKTALFSLVFQEINKIQASWLI